jgi:hypothetical protein
MADQAGQSLMQGPHRNDELKCLTEEFASENGEEAEMSHRSGVATWWQESNGYKAIVDMGVLLVNSHRNGYSMNEDHLYGSQQMTSGLPLDWGRTH